MDSNVSLKWWKFIILLLVGTLLGSGAVWQWYNVNIAKDQLELNKHKHNIELREKIEKSLFEINRLSRESLKIKVSTQAAELRKSQIKAESDLLIQDLWNYEEQLAKLENRDVRKIVIPLPFPDVRPTTPTGVTLIVTQSLIEKFRVYFIAYLMPLIIISILILSVKDIPSYIIKEQNHLMTIFASLDIICLLTLLPTIEIKKGPFTSYDILPWISLLSWISLLLLSSFVVSTYGFFKKRNWSYWLYYAQFVLRLTLRIYSFSFIYFIILSFMITMSYNLTLLISSFIVLLEYCRLLITIYLHRLTKTPMNTYISFDYKI